MTLRCHQAAASIDILRRLDSYSIMHELGFSIRLVGGFLVRVDCVKILKSLLTVGVGGKVVI